MLESLPFVTGYGVDIALLLDAYALLGLDGIAQVDLDVRQNAHQSLRDLGPMAFAVLQAVASRLEREGRLSGPLPTTFTAPGDGGPHTSPASRSSARRFKPARRGLAARLSAACIAQPPRLAPPCGAGRCGSP